MKLCVSARSPRASRQRCRRGSANRKTLAGRNAPFPHVTIVLHMTTPAADARNQRLTPLWVIALFLSLTELVAGIAVTQASGGVQVALTTFVIAFPLLVAAAFFIVLWSRPFVLYPPTEFGAETDVKTYVQAMSTNVNVVRANIEADIGVVRQRLDSETRALDARLASIEGAFRAFAEEQHGTRQLLAALERNQAEIAAGTRQLTTIIEQNSRYTIEVIELNKPKGKRIPMGNAEALAIDLAKLGFSTSAAGWNPDFYLKDLPPDGRDSVYVVYRDEGVAERVRAAVEELRPDMPVRLLPMHAAIAATETVVALSFGERDEDAWVVYRHAG